MGFWERVVQGDNAPAPGYRPPSTPVRADGQFRQPQYQEPWAQPPRDPVSYDVSPDVIDLMNSGDLGTWDRGNRGTKFANLDPDSDYYQAALQGKSRAMRSEPNRCPQCGDPRYFTRGGKYRPMCMACSYTGDDYSITTLN